MGSDLIPAMDAFPIPGPAWLFHVLLVFTFFLHLLFMNLTLGGTLMAAFAQVASGGRADDYRAVLAGRLMGVNTYAISLTITSGIAPLLFVQVLFGQYFYTATILLSWGWLFLLVFLMAGYYSAYLYKFKGTPTTGSGGTAWLLLAAMLFFVIAMIQVAVSLIHSQPEKWEGLASGPWAILGDPTYFIRLLHFVLSGIGLSGLVITWWAVRQISQGQNVEVNSKIAGYSWQWALWSTLLQVVDGFVLMVVLPRPVLSGLMKGGLTTLVPLTVSIVMGLGLLLMLFRTRHPETKPGLVSGTLGAMILTVAVMAITRHQVRGLYLEPYTSRFELTSATQWGNFVLFAVLLAAGLATVFYMVRLVMTNRATGNHVA